MGKRAPLSLRHTVTAALVAITTVALLVGVALVTLSLIQQRHSTVLYEAIQSVHLAEDVEINLLTHDRTRDGVVRSEAASDVRRSLDRATQFVSSDEEARVLASARDSVERYLADPKTPGGLEAAFADVERLITVNLGQANDARMLVAWWDRRANLAALGLAVILLVVASTVIAWVRWSTLEPVEAITRTLQRFEHGDHRARVERKGPKELQLIAAQLNSMAEALERQRSNQLTFIAGVAHDLRTPLSTLMLSVETTRLTELDPRSARIVELIRRQIGQIDRMVTDLLDASRIEAGKLELRFEAVDLRDVARVACDLFDRTSPHHRVRLVVGGEVPVAGDSMRLGQVATNLVSNAIKYSPDGGEVTVCARCDGPHAVFSVEDEGVGIDSADTERIFEPFRRSSRLAGSVSGIGLGLSVTKRIVEAHGGVIRVRRRNPRGSAFEVYLPLRPHAPPPAELRH